jgi:hypothetical protein|tara:strand:+ start:470 stop:1456 length:987 start_codon:yes stop_codon:yes gene_type:complete
MAEENKVELDTDDSQETDIQIEEKQEPNTKPEIGEVDLGYNDPIKASVEAKKIEQEPEDEKKEKQEKEEDTQEDNLNKISANVQKRIDQLTRKYREAQRREKAALDYAKGLQKKYSDVEKKSAIVDDNYVKEFDARIDAQREQVKHNLKLAIESNDSQGIMDANDKLTSLAVEKEKSRILAEQQKQEKEKKEQESKQQQTSNQQQPIQQQPIQQQNPPPPSAKAQEWAQSNTWFGQDKAMTNTAFGIHQDLIEQGFDSESEEYYNEIDKQMRDYFPQKFANDNKPIQTVASAGRKQMGRKTVKLTRSEVAIAKKLGVPLELYAKHVKR